MDEEEEDEESHITKEKVQERNIKKFNFSGHSVSRLIVPSVSDPFWFDDFHKTIKRVSEENIGCIMAFTICSELQEQLTELCEQLQRVRENHVYICNCFRGQTAV